MFTAEPIAEFHLNQNCDNTGTGAYALATCNLENYEILEGYAVDTRGHYSLNGNLDLTDIINTSQTISLWVKPKDTSNIVICELLNTEDYTLPSMEYLHIVITSDTAYINNFMVGKVILAPFKTLVSGNCYVKEVCIFDIVLPYNEILILNVKDYLDPIHWFPMTNSDLKDYSHKLSGELTPSVYNDFHIEYTPLGVFLPTDCSGSLHLPLPPNTADADITITLSPFFI